MRYFLVARSQELRREVVHAQESPLNEDVRNELRQSRRSQIYATYTGKKDVNGRLEQAGLRVAVLPADSVVLFLQRPTSVSR
jgi:hypothetical protein